MGHITSEVVGLITLVGLITIGLSTYLILYSHQIFEMLSPALNLFQRSENYTENKFIHEEHKDYDVIIIGLGRFGRRLTEMLDEHPGISYLGVDFDPGVINEWKVRGKDVIYGDMEDPDLLEQIPYKKGRAIVSTVPNNELSQQLIKTLEKNQHKGMVFVTTATERDYRQLRNYGLDDENILRPHQMAASFFYQSFLKDKVIQ
ncbi:NAD-binding protein [Catalinimonas niigatensis]|uniref:NAD-binding protein n=1 Tax=Catalinimonas niigatensis TaxID=1397264 RepID=UPI00266515BB|nr:NAD(P)-binding protein [Catalinimonas niigatensis]WPP52022.1 NAD(P)-binding protein [Catalinimonas niigatensis]